MVEVPNPSVALEGKSRELLVTGYMHLVEEVVHHLGFSRHVSARSMKLVEVINMREHDDTRETRPNAPKDQGENTLPTPFRWRPTKVIC